MGVERKIFKVGNKNPKQIFIKDLDLIWKNPVFFRGSNPIQIKAIEKLGKSKSLKNPEGFGFYRIWIWFEKKIRNTGIYGFGRRGSWSGEIFFSFAGPASLQPGTLLGIFSLRLGRGPHTSGEISSSCFSSLTSVWPMPVHLHGDLEQSGAEDRLDVLFSPASWWYSAGQLLLASWLEIRTHIKIPVVLLATGIHFTAINKLKWWNIGRTLPRCVDGEKWYWKMVKSIALRSPERSTVISGYCTPESSSGECRYCTPDSVSIFLPGLVLVRFC